MGIVERFAEAFNRRDVPGLLDCFTEEASYADVFFGLHAGRDNLRRMFERMFREGRDYRWSMDTVVEDGRRAAAEWTFGYVVSEAIPRSQGRPVRMAGMSLFELDGGRIGRYREYTDVGVALLQLGFAPEALAHVLAKKLPKAAA
jgi:steroid delta-isomerase-like uncharacterized protein